MVGKPTPLCGKGGTSVWFPRRGTRVAGGSVRWLIHASRSTSSARRPALGETGLRFCSQIAGPVAVEWGRLENRYVRTPGASDRRSWPSVSVWASEPPLTQYSLLELASRILGQVPVSVQRTR